MRTHACLRGHGPRTLALSARRCNEAGLESVVPPPRRGREISKRCVFVVETLAEAPWIAAFETRRQCFAGHLACDQAAGCGGQGEAEMLVAVAAIDVGQTRG